jgi:hypothetical protein
MVLFEIKKAKAYTLLLYYRPILEKGPSPPLLDLSTCPLLGVCDNTFLLKGIYDTSLSYLYHHHIEDWDHDGGDSSIENG